MVEDNCSTLDYCTIALVKRLKLRPLYNIRLKIEGFNTSKEVDKSVYSVPVRRRDGRLEFIQCYAVESLGDKCDLLDADIYKDICSKVKVTMKKVAKPKRIDLLLSLKSSHLMSDKLIKTVQGVKLFSGPLGFCVAGNIQQFLPKQQQGDISDIRVSKTMMTQARPLPSKAAQHFIPKLGGRGENKKFKKFGAKTFLRHERSGAKGRYPEMSTLSKKVQSTVPPPQLSISYGGRNGGRFAFTVGAKSRDNTSPSKDSRKIVKEKEDLKDDETGIGGSEELSQPAQTGSDTRHMSATITAAMPSVQTHTSSIESEYSPQRDNNDGSSDIQESQLLPSFQLESMNAFRVSCNISNRAPRLKRRAEISSHRQPQRED